MKKMILIIVVAWSLGMGCAQVKKVQYRDAVYAGATYGLGQ